MFTIADFFTNNLSLIWTTVQSCEHKDISTREQYLDHSPCVLSNRSVWALNLFSFFEPYRPFMDKVGSCKIN